MPFRAKEQSPQTGEWVARINPKTGKQVEVPALIPIDRLDVCPVPLEEFDDQKLKDWIWAANEYRVAKIPPESEPMARKAGGFLLQQAEQMRASAG